MSGKPDRKVAFAATRQVGNSPSRHRHIRKLREFYRLNKDLFAEGTYFLLVVRAPVEDWGDLEGRLKTLLHRARSSD